jgi:hypothetical protein
VKTGKPSDHIDLAAIYESDGHAVPALRQTVRPGLISAFF